MSQKVTVRAKATKTVTIRMKRVGQPGPPGAGQLWGDIEGTLANQTDLANALAGKKIYHGIQTAGIPTFDDTTHILTLPAVGGSLVYWHEGVRYSGAANLTVDFDALVTLTANTQYFVTLNDAAGTFGVSTNEWTIAPNVLVATVFWNGSTHAMIDERHSYTRDRDWHRSAHLTIGARISPADFQITAPSVASPNTINIAGGTIYDEDITTVLGQLTNCRVWYQTGVSTFTFVNSNTIYPTNVRFVDSSAAYALTDVATDRWINIWVYAAPDTARGLYAFVETKANAGYASVPSARAAQPPVLSGYKLTNEMKLLYRLIMKGDETFVEFTDYRATAPVPYGGAGTLSIQDESLGVACSDETTALTTGVAKATFRMPFAMVLTEVRASVGTAPTGASLIVDINEGGVSILSARLSIDATEKTSTTAATPAVISDTALADDAEITIDIDQIGSTIAGAGLKVYLLGRRA